MYICTCKILTRLLMSKSNRWSYEKSNTIFAMSCFFFFSCWLANIFILNVGRISAANVSFLRHIYTKWERNFSEAELKQWNNMNKFGSSRNFTPEKKNAEKRHIHFDYICSPAPAIAKCFAERKHILDCGVSVWRQKTTK